MDLEDLPEDIKYGGFVSAMEEVIAPSVDDSDVEELFNSLFEEE